MGKLDASLSIIVGQISLPKEFKSNHKPASFPLGIRDHIEQHAARTYFSTWC